MRLNLAAAMLFTTTLTVAARADVVQTFNLSGTLTDGTLSGTVAIDTTSGTIGQSNITLLDGGITYAFPGEPDQYLQSGQLNATYYGDNSYSPDATALSFAFPTDSLVGYTGGSICITTNTPCGSFISFDGLSPVAEDSLVTASLTLPTPEPSGFLLLGTGALTVGTSVRRRLLS